MQKFMKKRKARGFTLVELLIVIIIIGILAGALLLVAGAGTDKAEATKIVSNLRNGKAAAIMVYADYSAWPTVVGSLDDYLESGFSGGSYDIQQVTSAGFEGYYLGYTGLSGKTGVINKLTNMRTNGDVPLKTAGGQDYNGEDAVYLKVN